jgi:hypothetical protein
MSSAALTQTAVDSALEPPPAEVITNPLERFGELPPPTPMGSQYEEREETNEIP